MGRRTDRSAVGALVNFLVELIGVQVGFVTQAGLAGRALKVGKSLCGVRRRIPDHLHRLLGKRPDSAALAALANVLGEAVGVQVDFDMFSAFTKWAFHVALLSGF